MKSKQRLRWALAVFSAVIVGGFFAPSSGQERPAWPEPPVKLLILGTFHFMDAGLDSYRPKYDVDVLSPERQEEVVELLGLLGRFEPTKIAVERDSIAQARVDSLYRAFLDGAFELPANEVYQLGFRLARKLGHARVYGVDAERRFYEPWVDPDEYAMEHGQTGIMEPELQALYRKKAEFEDELKTRQTLREHLLRINTPERILRSGGQYLIGNFEVGEEDEYPGVDSKTAWYNRNLKIFANLQRISDLTGDRVLLIIGSGHVPILRHAAQASPQFELVEISEVLGDSRSGG